MTENTSQHSTEAPLATIVSSTSSVVTTLEPTNVTTQTGTIESTVSFNVETTTVIAETATPNAGIKIFIFFKEILLIMSSNVSLKCFSQ